MRTIATGLPPVTGLSEPQVRGKACVWCAVILNNTAIDLGTQEAQFAGSTAHWFPRSCRHCNIRKAYEALLDHLNGCADCTTDAERGTDAKACEDGRVLRQTWREARS